MATEPKRPDEKESDEKAEPQPRPQPVPGTKAFPLPLDEKASEEKPKSNQ